MERWIGQVPAREDSPLLSSYCVPCEGAARDVGGGKRHWTWVFKDGGKLIVSLGCFLKLLSLPWGQGLIFTLVLKALPNLAHPSLQHLLTSPLRFPVLVYFIPWRLHFLPGELCPSQTPAESSSLSLLFHAFTSTVYLSHSTFQSWKCAHYVVLWFMCLLPLSGKLFGVGVVSGFAQHCVFSVCT